VLLVFALCRTSVSTTTTSHSEHLRQNIRTAAAAAATTTFHRIHASLIIQLLFLGIG
jgi:hypothetical protein